MKINVKVNGKRKCEGKGKGECEVKTFKSIV